MEVERNLTAQQMWKEYAAACGAGEAYDAWAFGADADALAALVRRGEKTAAASAQPLYEAEHAPLPQPGQHSVVLGADGQAVCIIRTEKVAVVPFCEVDAAHAFREGEGDKSLAFWRRAHEAFFSQELQRAGLAFGPDMKVVCEEFRVVWPPDAAVRKEVPV